MKTKARKSLFFKSNRILALVLLLVIVIVVGVLELTNTTHIFHQPRPVSGTIPTINPSAQVQKGQPAGNSAANDSGGSSTPTSPKSSANSYNTGGALLSPLGSFVSNHHPGANGSPMSEESVCNTSPGATCYIKFVQGSAVKTLPAQTTDASGATYWSWNVSQAGLTSGAWQISAVASLNGQTKTATDPLNLEVQ